MVRSAKDAGVDVDLVNIMAMDYGRAAQDYGDLAIQAVKSTKDQIRSIYGNSDAAAFKMVGVTPMLGKNDDQGTFAQSDARDLVAFANSQPPRLRLVLGGQPRQERLQRRAVPVHEHGAVPVRVQQDLRGLPRLGLHATSPSPHSAAPGSPPPRRRAHHAQRNRHSPAAVGVKPQSR